MQTLKSVLAALMIGLVLGACTNDQPAKTEPKDTVESTAFKKVYESNLMEEFHSAIDSANTEGPDSILDSFFTVNDKDTPIEEIKKSAKDHIKKLKGLESRIDELEKEAGQAAPSGEESHQMESILSDLKISVKNQIEVLLFFSETREDPEMSIDDYLAEAETLHEKAAGKLTKLEKESGVKSDAKRAGK